MMDRATGIKAVDLFLKNRVFREEQYLISFLGGEPLINFELIKEVVLYTKKTYPIRDIEFLILTNGSLLTRQSAKFIKEHCIRVRITCDLGKSNWKRIVSHLVGYEFVGMGFVLANVGIEGLYANFLKVHRLGIKRFYFCPEFLYSKWKRRELLELSVQIKKIAKFLSRNRLSNKLFISYLHDEGQQLKYLDSRESFQKEICIIQELLHGNFVVMPNGDLFSCDIGTFVSEELYEKNKLGSLACKVSFRNMFEKLRSLYGKTEITHIPCLQPELIKRKRQLAEVLNSG